MWQAARWACYRLDVVMQVNGLNAWCHATGAETRPFGFGPFPQERSGLPVGKLGFW